MKQLLTNFWKDEDGATIMEYILMIAVGAGIIALIFPYIKDLLRGFTETSAEDMANGITGDNSELKKVTPNGPTK